MLTHVALPSCQTEGGYWAGERGLLSTAQVQCGKNGGFDVFSVWLYLFIYIVIVLYCYMLIYLYRYCIVYLLYFGHIRYFIFRNCHFFRLLIMTRITVVAVFLSFIELSYCLFLISWQFASGLRSFLPIYLMTVSAKSYFKIQSFFKSWWQRIVSWFQC